METTTNLETLEEGIVISKEGRVKKFNSFADIQEGELFLKFMSEGVKSELKNGGSVLISKKGVLISKTAIQARMEAVLVHFYYTILPLGERVVF